MKVIFDIDGTIADCSHRLHLITDKPKQWDKFHAECVNDKPIERILELLQAIRDDQDRKIVFITTRPYSSEDATRHWIKTHTGLVSSYQIFMRKDGDYRPDDIIKLEILERENIKPEEVLFIVEDRKRVVDAYRKAGYTVLQCADGDY